MSPMPSVLTVKNIHAFKLASIAATARFIKLNLLTKVARVLCLAANTSPAQAGVMRGRKKLERLWGSDQCALCAVLPAMPPRFAWVRRFNLRRTQAFLTSSSTNTLLAKAHRVHNVAIDNGTV